MTIAYVCATDILCSLRAENCVSFQFCYACCAFDNEHHVRESERQLI